MGAEAPAGVSVVGSVHMDVVATADRLPGKGESVVGHRVSLSPGGKAGNQAAQAALNGARTFLVGRVGLDVFGDQPGLHRRRRRVRLDHRARRRAASGAGGRRGR